MPRRVSLVVFFGIVVCVLLSTGLTAGAQTGSGQGQQDEVAAAQERLAQIRSEAAMSYASYENALWEMNQLDSEIARTNEELAVAEQEFADAQADLERRATQVYQSGNVAFLDVLAGVTSFEDFIRQFNLLLTVLGEEQERVQQVSEARDALAAEKAALESQRAQRAATLDEAVTLKDSYTGAEAEAQSYLDSLSAELQAAIEAEQARQAELARQAGEELIQELDAPPPPQPVQPVAQTTPAVDPAAAQRAAAAEEAARQAAEQAAAAEEAARQAAAQQAAEEEAAALQAEAEQARLAAEQAAIEQEAAERAAAQAALAEQQNLAPPEGQGDTATGLQDNASGLQDNASDQYGTTTEGTTASDTGTAPPPSGSGSGVVAEAAKYLGTPYVLGGPEQCIPGQAMDCSCLTMTAFAPFGVSLPDSPGGQMGYGARVSGEPAAGDNLFWSEDGSGVITHVGIAEGGGTTLHASVFAGHVVSGTPINAISGYVGAERLL